MKIQRTFVITIEIDDESDMGRTLSDLPSTSARRVLADLAQHKVAEALYVQGRRTSSLRLTLPDN